MFLTDETQGLFFICFKSCNYGHLVNSKRDFANRGDPAKSVYDKLSHLDLHLLS